MDANFPDKGNAQILVHIILHITVKLSFKKKNKQTNKLTKTKQNKTKQNKTKQTNNYADTPKCLTIQKLSLSPENVWTRLHRYVFTDLDTCI